MSNKRNKDKKYPDGFRDNKEYPLDEEEAKDEIGKELYPKLKNKSLSDLSDDGILVFPIAHSKKKKNDDSDDMFKEWRKEPKIIETFLSDDIRYVRFGNIAGFVGLDDDRLTIRSRFSRGKDDYFLHYMLSKVLNLNINIVELDISHSFDNQIFQLLMFMFPESLNKALRKGIFKLYQRYKYNDMNIKGTIDIARHIKENTPFLGKVAYSTREFTKDNYLIHLIRHTIEHIRTSMLSGRAFLNSTEETRQNVRAIELATPSYSLGDRKKIITENKNSMVSHAYYSEYRVLQEICLMILELRKHDIKDKKKQMRGILFDVSWLWEEYVYTLLKEDDFEHPCNRNKIGGISVFSDSTRNLYPDFYSKDRKIVADAKYKPLDEDGRKHLELGDLSQLITYSYIMNLGKSDSAIIIHPGSKETDENRTWYHRIGNLNGFGATIYRFVLRIPQYRPNEKKGFEEFKCDIEKEESIFKKKLRKLL